MVTIGKEIKPASIPKVIETYFADLKVLQNNDALVPGQYYKILDFQTVYDIPDYDSLGNPKEEIETAQGPVEQIIVMAVDGSTIGPNAISCNYPKDKLKYDFNWIITEVNFIPAKGRIIERIDEYGNRTDYDHRNVYFKRYKEGGLYKSYKENETAPSFLKTFNNISLIQNLVTNVKMPDYARFTSINGSPFLLPNNVFLGTATDIEVLSLCENNTMPSGFSNTKITAPISGVNTWNAEFTKSTSCIVSTGANGKNYLEWIDAGGVKNIIEIN